MKKLPDAAPRHLSAEARRLWADMRKQYCLDDVAGLALLRAACESHDRAQQARRLIETEGLVSVDRFGQSKAHPAIAVERDARGQLMAALKALRLAPGEEAE